jgi:hypothetical protein
VRPTQLANQSHIGFIRNAAFFIARALPSRSWDLALSARMGAEGGYTPPFIPAAEQRSGRIPALPYLPLRCDQYTWITLLKKIRSLQRGETLPVWDMRPGCSEVPDSFLTEK